MKPVVSAVWMIIDTVCGLDLDSVLLHPYIVLQRVADMLPQYLLEEICCNGASSLGCVDVCGLDPDRVFCYIGISGYRESRACYLPVRPNRTKTTTCGTKQDKAHMAVMVDSTPF